MKGILLSSPSPHFCMFQANESHVDIAGVSPFVVLTHAGSWCCLAACCDVDLSITFPSSRDFVTSGRISHAKIDCPALVAPRL